jgi:hypothetical protein
VLLLFLFLLVAVPVLPGGAYTDLTWSMLHTQHGWAGLAVVLLFYLEPRRIGGRDLWMDAVVLAALMLFLYFLQIIFAVVALAFLAANAMTSGYKFRLAVTSLAISLAVTLAIEVAFGYNSAYLAGILAVVRDGPAVALGWNDLLELGLEHRLEIFLCYAALAIVVVTGRSSLFDFFFVTGCLVAGLLLLAQSGTANAGLLCLIGVLLVLAELAQRRELSATGPDGVLGWSQRVPSTLVLGLALVFVAEPTYVAARGLHHHHQEVSAARSAGAPGLGGIHVPPRASGSTRDGGAVAGHIGAGSGALGRQRLDRIPPWEYAPPVEEGLVLLESVPLDGKAVVTFQQRSPFGVLLGLRPTSTGYPLHVPDSRGTERSNATDGDGPGHTAEEFFSDADYVMVPVVSNNSMQLEAMNSADGDDLLERFNELKRSEHWRLFERRQ